MNEARVQELRIAFSGPIATERVQYLIHLKMFLEESREQGIGFVEVIRVVREDLRSLIKCNLDVTDTPALALREFANVAELIHRLPRRPLDELETIFLQDTVGFLNFALRNGFTFVSALEPVAHDFCEIERCGYSLQATMEVGLFRPKVSGYRNIHSESFAEEEAEEYS